MPTIPTDGALSVVEKNGNTTVTTIGRAQTDVVLNPDGSLNVTIYPSVTRYDAEGETITAPQLDGNNPFTAVLPVEGVLIFLTAVRAAWEAKNAPVVVAPEPAPEPAPVEEPVA